MVDSFEYLNVELFGSCRVEWQAEHHEGIGKALHTNPYRPVAHVRLPCLRDRVVVDVYYAVQVESDNLSNIVQLLEVVLAVGDKGREGDGREVTDRGFVWGGILDDLRAQVGGLNRPKVLLIRLG